MRRGACVRHGRHAHAMAVRRAPAGLPRPATAADAANSAAAADAANSAAAADDAAAACRLYRGLAKPAAASTAGQRAAVAQPAAVAAAERVKCAGADRRCAHCTHAAILRCRRAAAVLASAGRCSRPRLALRRANQRRHGGRVVPRRWCGRRGMQPRAASVVSAAKAARLPAAEPNLLHFQPAEASACHICLS